MEAKTIPLNENVLVRLKEVQATLGHLPEQSLKEISQSSGVPLSEVYGVATFYSFLTIKPKGRNIIRVCRSEPCAIKDAEGIVGTLEKALGINPGQTTADANFTLEYTNCIGACDVSPAMLINDDLYGNLTPAKIQQILQSYM